MATTLKISANRLNMDTHSPRRIIRPELGIFKPRRECSFGRSPLRMRGTDCSEGTSVDARPAAQGIRYRGSQARAWRCDSRRGCRISDLSIEGIDYDPPPNAAADWQPGAILRMPFSERLCRNGGIVCGQALMAFADTAMVIANLAANRGYRPMTTVDQTTHFMRAATASDVLADARVVRMGRTMSFGRVTLSCASDDKPVAMVSSAFAMLT